jgi:hypothetical protein
MSKDFKIPAAVLGVFVVLALFNSLHHDPLQDPAESHWITKVLSIRNVRTSQAEADSEGIAHYARVRHPNGHEGEVLLHRWVDVEAGEEIRVFVISTQDPISGRKSEDFIGVPIRFGQAKLWTAPH